MNQTNEYTKRQKILETRKIDYEIGIEDLVLEERKLHKDLYRIRRSLKTGRECLKQINVELQKQIDTP